MHRTIARGMCKGSSVTLPGRRTIGRWKWVLLGDTRQTSVAGRSRRRLTISAPVPPLAPITTYTFPLWPKLIVCTNLRRPVTAVSSVSTQLQEVHAPLLQGVAFIVVNFCSGWSTQSLMHASDADTIWHVRERC